MNVLYITRLHILYDPRMIYIYIRNPRWERWVFARFVFSLFFHSQLSKCPKTQGKKKNKKNNPVRRILGKSMYFFCVFCYFWFFSRFFLLSQAQLSKNSKKTKKNNPVRRILGKSIQDCFFLFFWFIWFFSRFLLSQAQLSKNSRKTKKTQKTKKNKKNNPVRRILGKSIQDCFFFVFFGLFGFSRGFCCPKPNCPKTRGKPKKPIL